MIIDKLIERININGTILKYPIMLKKSTFLKWLKYKNLSIVPEVKYTPSDNSDNFVIIFFSFIFNFCKSKLVININIKTDVETFKMLEYSLCIPHTNVFPLEI